MKKYIKDILIGVAVILLIGFVSVIPVSCLLSLTTNSNFVQTTLEDSIERTINNVVHIRNNTGQWQGSGVLIAPDLVLTARHVAETGEDFEIKTNNGKIYRAERAITSKKYDLGFIKLKDNLPCTTIIGDISECRLGQTVYAIGSPFGELNQNSITAGIVSSLARKLENFGCPLSYGWSCTFQTDAAGHPGNSGCPVYTLDGKVRGILVGGFSNAVIYCIPAILVSNDCQVIQLMFLMDEYQSERKSGWEEEIELLYKQLYDLSVSQAELRDELLNELQELKDMIKNNQISIEKIYEKLGMVERKIREVVSTEQ
jgi:S1-C subfamily serine protease